MLGLSAVGDDVLVLRYEREREPGPALLEYVTLELGNTPAGAYRLTISVTDPASAVRAMAEGLIEVAPRSR